MAVRESDTTLSTYLGATLLEGSIRLIVGIAVIAAIVTLVVRII